MFFIINREKLISYVISITTVFVLLVMAGTVSSENNTIETGVNAQNEIRTNTIVIKNDSKENNTNNNTCETIKK